MTKRTAPKLLYVGLCVGVLGLAALLNEVKGCFFPSFTPIRRVVAPDEKHTAIIVEGGGEGDATVGFFRVAALCEGSDGCTANNDTTIASAEGSGLSNVSWESSTHLIVYYAPSDTRFIGKDATKDGMKINYVPVGK